MLTDRLLAERLVARRGWSVFGGADDSLGALRWTLALLRRALGLAGALRGGPLKLGLRAGAEVEVLSLASGEPDPALGRGELREGSILASGRTSM